MSLLWGFGYKFQEKPDYAKLRFLLVKIMLEHDVTPNLKMDWTRLAQAPTTPE